MPDFLCIGAQKAGTSWLRRNIRDHPAVWMPPIKEIHYFDLPDPRPLIVTACTTTAGYSGSIARQKLRVWLRQLVTPGREAHLGWHLRYFLRRRDDAWYASLFTPGPGQITGDVTPAYARRMLPRLPGSEP